MVDIASMLDSALGYQARNLPIFPVCRPVPEKEGWCIQHGDHTIANEKRAEAGRASLADPGKHPLVSWAEFQQRVPTAEEVRAWWKRWPDANIGMVTGVISGLVVLDSDGFDAYTAVLSRGGVEPTPTVITGKPNGFHWYLKHPGRPVRNFAGDRGVKGLDFRGDGGYVVLPPSLHRSGVTYRWHENLDTEPQVVPLWLLKLLADGSSQTASTNGETHPAIDVESVLRGVSEGQRDDTLYRTACRLRADNVPIEYAELLIREAARNCVPPFSETVAVAKIREAYRRFSPTTTIIPGGKLVDNSESAGDKAWSFAPENAADFLARELPALDWLIDGLVRQSAVGFFYGAPGALKTYIATDLAIAIASGQPFLNRAATQHRVLIIEDDTIEADYQQTYLAPLVAARGIDCATLADWLYVACPSEMRLDVDARVHALGEWCAEFHPALVVLDAFYLMHNSDGMTGRDIRPMILSCRWLRDTFGCTVIVIDHARKAVSGATNSNESGIDRLYGGVEKASASDLLMYSVPVKWDQGATSLRFEKLRGIRKPDALSVRFKNGRIILDNENESKSASITVYDWLGNAGGGRTRRQIQTGTGLSMRSVAGVLTELHQQGRVQKLGKSGREDTWGLAIPDDDESEKEMERGFFS